MIILLIGLTFFSCNRTRITRENTVIQDTIPQVKSIEVVLSDTLTRLFNKALVADTLEFIDIIDELEYPKSLPIPPPSPSRRTLTASGGQSVRTIKSEIER